MAQQYRNHTAKAALPENWTFYSQIFLKLLNNQVHVFKINLSLNNYPWCLRSFYYQLNQYKCLLVLSSSQANCWGWTERSHPQPPNRKMNPSTAWDLLLDLGACSGVTLPFCQAPPLEGKSIMRTSKQKCSDDRSRARLCTGSFHPSVPWFCEMNRKSAAFGLETSVPLTTCINMVIFFQLIGPQFAGLQKWDNNSQFAET